MTILEKELNKAFSKLQEKDNKTLLEKLHKKNEKPLDKEVNHTKIVELW